MTDDDENAAEREEDAASLARVKALAEQHEAP